MNHLETFVRETLSVFENWRGLIEIEPSFDRVDKISVDAIGLERGPRRHFIHAHMTVTVQHRGKINHKFGQRQWQELVNRKMPFLRGSYVAMSLMSARALNYAVKGDTGRRSALPVRTWGMRDAVMFN